MVGCCCVFSSRGLNFCWVGFGRKVGWPAATGEAGNGVVPGLRPGLRTTVGRLAARFAAARCVAPIPTRAGGPGTIGTGAIAVCGETLGLPRLRSFAMEGIFLLGLLSLALRCASFRLVGSQ